MTITFELPSEEELQEVPAGPARQKVEGYLTGYGIARVLNGWLSEKGLKNVTGPFVYNYIKKGYIPSTDFNGQKLVSEEDAREWMVVQLARRMAR
jgi:hypothetical protein